MHAAERGIAVERFVEKECRLTGERFGFGRRRGDRNDRTPQPQRHLAEHQSAGGTAQTHHREAPLGSGGETRFEFADCFFQASLQIRRPQYATAPYGDAREGRTRRWRQKMIAENAARTRGSPS
jgi:hypothetical protein